MSACARLTEQHYCLLPLSNSKKDIIFILQLPEVPLQSDTHASI